MAAPTSAQHALPARTFEPSLPAVAPPPVPATPEWWRSGGPRIRRTDARLDFALRNGLERSVLLRDLVKAIEAGDVVVYAGIDPLMMRGLSGRLTFIGTGGRYRYVRVMVNPELSGDEMIAALAHEFRHVVEVIEHPDVTSESGLTQLYRRIGQSNRAAGTLGWETIAAQNTTYDVRRELKTGRTPVVARRDVR
jgi:hypothetical protein